LSCSRLKYIFWIDAASPETAESSFKAIADYPEMKVAGVESSMQSVLQWISQSPGMWLLVIDNADDIPGTTTNYIPLGNHGNVLITSRNPDTRRLVSPGAHAEVKEMEEEDAVLLLLKAVFLTDASQDVKAHGQDDCANTLLPPLGS
jgi:hypothetical protein